MLLRRVSDHASHSYYNTARDSLPSKTRFWTRFDCRDCVGQYALYNFVRSLNVLCTVMCSLIGLAEFVEAAFLAEEASSFDEAVAATNADGSDTLSSLQILIIIGVNNRGKYAVANAVERSIVAVLFVIVSSAYTLFFPICIVMFRRIELKLDSHIREMSHRSDHGSAFLPFEFFPENQDKGIQVELPIVEAKSYLQNIKSSATAQRMRFVFCLLLELITLNVLAAHALFVAISVWNTDVFSPDCGRCKPCQSVNTFMQTWSTFTPELIPLLTLSCHPLSLMFALWLMTTPEDRALLLHPGTYINQAAPEQPSGTETSSRAQRIRLGIDLQ
jgi:hypothetical protein